MTIRTLILSAASGALLIGCGGGDVTVKEASDTSTKAATPAKDIRVVGSSTVYPFSTKVAQEFKNKTGFNVVVESTGSGGGHKLFCEDIGVSTPDITNSSRRQKKSEFDMCGENGVTDCLAALRGEDKKAFATIAHTIREDGKWIDSGENDNAIVQTLVNTPTAVGVFGYSFLDQNADKIKGANVGSAEPTFEKIASGEYPVSRSLYFYVKKANMAVTPGLQDFALEFTSDAAAGPGGYLEEIGLVPLPTDQRAQVRSDVENMTAYSQ